MFNFEWAKRSHKGLRRWVLYIVHDGPKSGAEIMDVMEGNLQGWWRPSPGSIYPMLKSMVEEGVLTRSSDNKYSLTAKGREETEHPFPWVGRTAASPRSVDGAIEEISSYVSYLEDLAQSKDAKISENASKIKELSGRLARIGGN
jgi:DNA-binding PadR family transcriptional regulator